MKKTKVIIPALGILLLSTAASVTGTVAWFSSNASVSATGMSVKARTDEALVIGKDVKVGSAITVDLSDVNEDVSLIPITFSDGKYQYCSNGAEIDPLTGYRKDGAAVDLLPTPGASNGLTGDARLDYYKEFVVYLAAAGQAIDDAKLNATVTFGTASLEQQAATVDFSVLAATGTAVTPSTQAISHEKTVNAAMSSTTITLSDTQDFPLNTSNTSVPVLMRLYIDGDLKDTVSSTTEVNKAYVRSENVSLEALSVSVTFTLA